MKKIIHIVAVVCLVIGALPTFAQLDRSQQPKAGPAPRIELGQYQTFEMANGLKVIVVEDHKLPRISFSLRIDNDPVMEGEFKGYVDATGSLLKTGTTSRSKAQIDDEIGFIGAGLYSSSSNVSGSCLTKFTDKFLSVFSDVILHPSFPEDELTKWKKQTISSIEMSKTDPNAISENVSRILVYGKEHPYGEVVTATSVEKVSIEKCKEYYNTYFRPNVSYLVMVGDINLKQAKELSNKYFSKWKKAQVPNHSYNFPKAWNGNRVIFIDKPGAVQSVINITYPVDLKPGSSDQIKARVANGILGGGGFSARLFGNLREKHSYTYGAYSSLSADRLCGSFDAGASVRNSVTDSAVYQFLYEMKRITTEKATQGELTVIQNSISGSFSRSLERPETMAEFAVNTMKYKLPADFYATYLKKVEAVTLNDVEQMSAKYIKPDNCIIIIVGNRDEVADKLKSFSTSGVVEFYDAEGNPVKAVSEVPANVSVESIVNKYVTAIGGKQAIAAVNNLSVKMKASVQGQEISMEVYHKGNSLSATYMKMGNMLINKQILNGDKAISAGMQGNKEILGNDLLDLKMSSNLCPEMDYAAFGASAVVKGAETVNGTEAWKVEVTLPSGKKSVEYYSKDSGLKIRTIQTQDSPQGSVSIITDILDYKDFNGYKIPTRLSQDMGGMKLSIELESAEINQNIDDKLFEF
jgi:predicted Zn-dependent peptidase